MRRENSTMPIAHARVPAETFVLSEKDIQKTVTDHLKSEGWRVFEFEHEFSERKKKTLGEPGMPDILAIQYEVTPIDTEGFSKRLRDRCAAGAIVLWIELKRIDKRGRTTKAGAHQKAWHEAERARGALVVVAGEDFPASIEGWMAWYTASGLARRG